MGCGVGVAGGVGVDPGLHGAAGTGVVVMTAYARNMYTQWVPRVMALMLVGLMAAGCVGDYING